jgi:hypothetical protein
MTCVCRLENFQYLADMSEFYVYLEKALKVIAKSLGKKDWNFDIDPCSNHPNWATLKPIPTSRLYIVENNVTCNCSVAGDNFCHVVEMYVCSISTSKQELFVAFFSLKSIIKKYIRLIYFILLIV